MKRSNVTTYNAIAILFIGLTIFSFLCTLLVFARAIKPPPFLAPGINATPTIIIPATDTITPTPSNTPTPTVTPTPTDIPPTNTPVPTATPVPPSETPIPPTPVPSATPIPSNTPIPSATPTATMTQPPTKPPTATRRVTATRTPRGFVASATPKAGEPTQPQPATPTLFPTAKPQSNQPFVVDDKSPIPGGNPDFTSGCKYQGVAGVVSDLGKKPLPGIKYKVNITGPDKKTIQTTYTPQNSQLYAPGSYVAQLGEQPAKATYTLQLVNSAGKAISDKIDVTFDGTCEGNVIYVNFNQVKPADLP